MAAKKKAPAKRQRAVKKPRTTKLKKPSVIQELKKILFGLMMLIACILFFAMVADIFLNQLPGKSPEPKPAQVAAAAQETATKKSKTPAYPSQSERNEARETETGIANKQSSGTPKNLSPSKQLKAKPAKTFKFEIFDDANQPVVEGPPDPDPYEPIEPVTPEEKKKPRIAIIIDDIGYDRRLARAFYELDANLTFSILPLAPHGREIADFLHARGAQLMLHLPMEPMEYPEINPGPGAILAKMPPDVLLFNLKRDLNDIPYISGVNNHMGSRLTTMSDKMNQIFTILKKRELFFIDSLTAYDSQCRSAARLMQVPFATRDVFLDNIQDPDYITGQFDELIDLARRRGRAIGIGHPYKATLETLKILLPRLNAEIELVPVKQLTVIQRG